MTSTHLTPSAAYSRARAELVAAERELRAAAARVAAVRAGLPPGPAVDPGTPLTTATGKPTTLGRLLGDHRTLLVYNLMFDEGWELPCPTCAMWVDGLDAVTPHLTERTAVAVLAPASPGQLAELVRWRRWGWVQVVSTQPSALTDQLGLRTRGGGLEPAVSCYALDDTDVLRLHWHGGAELTDPALPPDEPADRRGLDPLCVTWALLDLLPQGRGDWTASRSCRP